MLWCSLSLGRERMFCISFWLILCCMFRARVVLVASFFISLTNLFGAEDKKVCVGQE